MLLGGDQAMPDSAALGLLVCVSPVNSLLQKQLELDHEYWTQNLPPCPPKVLFSV